MKAPKRRAPWSQHIKTQSLRASRRRIDEARANYRRIESIQERMNLAHEIANTRSQELCLAYRNLLMVAYGYKRRRTRKTSERVYKTPCVIFVVKKKWPISKKSARDAQHLPRELLTYATLGDRRVLCAVATDVQSADRFQRAKAHSASGVFLDRDGTSNEFGSVTCAVQTTSNAASNPYFLSCQHVLTPKLELGAAAITNRLRIMRDNPAGSANPGADVVARSAPYGGAIYGEGRASFDVQLAEISDRNWLKQALIDLNLSSASPYVADRQSLDQLAADHNFQILVPSNHPNWLGKKRSPVVASFSAYMEPEFGLEYEIWDGGQPHSEFIHHWLLIELRVLGASRPEKGDSGSPVIVRLADGKAMLVGMHIGGSDSVANSYSIPAWQLFDRVNYYRLPSNPNIRPVNP